MATTNTPSQIATRIASNIRSQRERRGLSRERLAFMAGISTGTIQNIEAVRHIPNISTLLSICAALEIEPALLFSAADRAAA